MKVMSMPLAALRHHVTGAIERGEKTAIVEVREKPIQYNTEASLWLPGNFPMPSAVRVQNGALVRDGEIVAQFADTPSAVLVLRSCGWEIETAQRHADGDVVQLVNYAVK